MRELIDLIKSYKYDERLTAYMKIKATLPEDLKDKFEVLRALYNFIDTVMRIFDKADEIKEDDLYPNKELTAIIQDLLELTDKDKELCNKLAEDIIDYLDEYTVETYVVVLVSYYVQKYGVYKKLPLDNILKQYAESINAMKLIFQYKDKFYEIFADLEDNCLDFINPENVDIGQQSLGIDLENYSIPNYTKVTFLPDIYHHQACNSFNEYLDISDKEKITIDTVHEGVLGVDALRGAYYDGYDFTHTADSEVSELVNRYPSVLVEKYAKLAIAKTFERCLSLLDKYQINIIYDKFTRYHMGLLKDKEFIFKYNNSWYKAYSNNKTMRFEILPLNVDCDIINQSSYCDYDEDECVKKYMSRNDDKYITWYPSVYNLCDKNEDTHELAVMSYASEYWWVHCC